ncbi:MAG TPA: terminase small subunit, partial [Flavobacteriales bacterium]|nr:terminase small subunit [Flavobacteriales bacterium]
MGRPSTFTQKTADEICFKIIDGLSLRAICAVKGMPPLRTLMGWVENNESFQQQYTRARQMQADIKFDDLKDLARTATPEDIQCIKLQIDTAKWELSKTLPKKYGEKIDIDMTADVTTHQYEITTKDDPDDI